jgi:hypothetical protein
MQLYLDVVFLVISEPRLDNSFSLKAKSCANNTLTPDPGDQDRMMDTLDPFNAPKPHAINIHFETFSWHSGSSLEHYFFLGLSRFLDYRNKAELNKFSASDFL